MSDENSVTTPSRYFCTLFDKNYLSRGLALGESLRSHCPAFHWYVLCLDDETYNYLRERALPNVVLVQRRELEGYDPQLAATRPTRSLVEYYFTITPAWVRFVLDHYPEVDLINYVDADFVFFDSPEPLFEEMGKRSIAVVEHRFPPALEHLTKHGRFNVGWLSFRRDEQGLACVRWWRERCIEWCYDRIEGDRFADQKYLDQWPDLFSNVAVLQHKGVSVAPWNLDARFHVDDDGRRRIAEEPLICFHYHGLKHLFGPIYESGLGAYDLKLDAMPRKTLFRPYLQMLLAHEAKLMSAGITIGHAKSLRRLDGSLADLRRRVRMLLSSLSKGTYLWADRA